MVTCISKPDVYESCLLSSINATRGNFDVEIIPLINHNNLYSASNALNICLDAANSDIVIFAHQDVKLLPSWFDILSSTVNKLPEDWGILGSAGIDLQYKREDIGKWGGARNVKTVAVGTVYDNDPEISGDPYWDGAKELTQSHCADECLFILNKKTGLRFDAQFTGFHFYGVDICLQARSAAYSVYCSHLPIVHYGKYSASFSGDKKYWVYLRYLHNKWKLRFPDMLGTHMHWGKDPERETDELTSYISLQLEDNSGLSVGIKSMGIEKAKLSVDESNNFIGGYDA